MLIETDTQVQLISESPGGAGVTSREGSIKSDSLVATLWADTVLNTLDVSVYTLTDTGKQFLLFSFPTLSSGTTTLILKKAGISLQRFLVVATYSDACTYEVYIRAVSTAGSADASVLGAADLSTSQTNIDASGPQILIPAALVDRQGLVVKNWSTSGNLFLSETAAKLPGQAYPLAPRDSIGMDIGAGITIYAISDAGTIDVRIAEAGT